MPKSSRTTLEEQIATLARVTQQDNHPALRDALHSLSELRKIKEEVMRENPNVDRIADLMVNLVISS